MKSGVIQSSEKEAVMGINGLDIAVMVLFSPTNGFLAIKKDRVHFKWIAPTVILFWSLISSIAKIYLTHYPLQTSDPTDVNLFQQVFSFILPLILWVLGNYYVTCIFSGEVKLREVYAATCYALLPYAVFTIPWALFTQVLDIGYAGLCHTADTILILWVVILILISIGEMNSYSLGKTIGVALISLGAVVFIAVVFVLLYVLGAKLYNFLAELVLEYRLLLFQ